MATLDDFRTELEGVLGLDNSLTGDQPLMDLWINEGVVDVLMKTKATVLPFEMTLTANEGDYTLDTDILIIIDLFVTNQSSDYTLSRITPSELLDMRRNVGASSPSRYYATSGANLLMLYPTPTAADTISGIYVPRPATLTDDTDEPTEIPAEWHKLVSFYALFRAADMDDDASSQMGERYRALYAEGVNQARASFYKHGGTRMAPARLRPNRRTFPANPSVPSYP